MTAIVNDQYVLYMSKIFYAVTGNFRRIRIIDRKELFKDFRTYTVVFG